jgi:hypothetical protein
VAVALVVLVGIGWVARTTVAQQSHPKPVETVLAPPPVVSAHSPLELEPASSLPAPGESDDPEKNVQAFIEQNRKVAETQLKNLRDEAEKLRGRLQKVEAGIRRWENLLTALQTNEGSASDLAPIPKTRRGFNARVVPPPVAPGAPARPSPPDPAPDKPPPAPNADLPVPSPSEPAPR